MAKKSRKQHKAQPIKNRVKKQIRKEKKLEPVMEAVVDMDIVEEKKLAQLEAEESASAKEQAESEAEIWCNNGEPAPAEINEDAGKDIPILAFDPKKFAADFLKKYGA